jgi:membrane protease YdiL (CAAX protease family)
LSNKFNVRVLAIAIAFEAALGAAGWLIALVSGVPIVPRLQLSSDVAVRAAFALLPMLGILWLGLWSNWPPLVRLRELVESVIGQLFRGAPWWALALVAIAAGVGEELLFRGALQPLAERALGATGGLIVASVVFGALHAASATYFILATGVGVYLGWLAQHYNDLVAPIAVHAAYDFVALAVLVSCSSPRAEERESQTSS